ncbi:cobalamin biosynthesis protein [Ferroplasma sp.]|uniref:cobalamin biosynthesis protein n=1 Tax=Ferroplasma sp. TaxID=2591003 RepID=UPI00260E7EDF|nr:cobalamin biosynthesis protein [Ferroplasma sp.]MCL4452510.1 cobalamin biosynthesis protein [Candidatus Thermoplasmatota archaeon]
MINGAELLILIVILAITLDIIIGEPPNAIHPVVIIGRTISRFKPYFMGFHNRILSGCLFLIWVIILNSMPVIVVLYILYRLGNILFLIIFIIIYVYFLKSTFSINSMGKHIRRIVNSITDNDIIMARKHTSMVVRRPTDNMDVHGIASASIETIAEGFVDGYLTPLFFYSFLGLAGALASRVINTMDSNIAYRDSEYYEIGRCTAIGDSIINFFGSRMVPGIFRLSAFLMGYSTGKIRIINTTDSLNAGYSIGSMASVLNVRLEKTGEYIINAQGQQPEVGDIRKAMNIYYLSALIFLILFVIPVIAILFFIHLLVIL